MFFLRNANIPLLSNFEQIPFDYFERNDFYITADNDLFALSILAILPQLLKERFPDCKVNVVIPTDVVIEDSNYELVFNNNPYVNSIVNYDNTKDFYKLSIMNYLNRSNASSGRTLENIIIQDMMRFWKFNIPAHDTYYIQKIYLFKEEVEYVQDLCNACGFSSYSILNVINPNDRLIEICKYYKMKNIISLNKIADVKMIYYLSDKNVLDLSDFILPDRMKLALIDTAAICIGENNELFNMMRSQHPNIYCYNPSQKLIHIKYL